jgi:hypothetical protein
MFQAGFLDFRRMRIFELGVVRLQRPECLGRCLGVPFEGNVGRGEGLVFGLQGNKVGVFLDEGLVEGVAVGLEGSELVWGGCLGGGFVEGCKLGLELSYFELEGAYG